MKNVQYMGMCRQCPVHIPLGSVFDVVISVACEGHHDASAAVAGGGVACLCVCVSAVCLPVEPAAPSGSPSTSDGAGSSLRYMYNHTNTYTYIHCTLPFSFTENMYDFLPDPPEYTHVHTLLLNTRPGHNI